MTEVFVKRYQEEEHAMFYLHFQDGEAVRQVEVSAAGKFFFSTENPDVLYDRSLDDLKSLYELEYITKEEFEKIWADE